jgi:hypothetical protein
MQLTICRRGTQKVKYPKDFDKTMVKLLLGVPSNVVRDAWSTLTAPLSTATVGNTIVEPAVNLACSHPQIGGGNPCPAQARAAGETADTAIDVLSYFTNLFQNSNGPSVNTNPRTPIPSATTSPWLTWTPAPTSTGVTPTITLTPRPTETPILSPTPSLTSTQLPTWTPTLPYMSPTSPYITPTYDR